MHFSNFLMKFFDIFWGHYVLPRIHTICLKPKSCWRHWKNIISLVLKHNKFHQFHNSRRFTIIKRSLNLEFSGLFKSHLWNCIDLIEYTVLFVFSKDNGIRGNFTATWPPKGYHDPLQWAEVSRYNEVENFKRIQVLENEFFFQKFQIFHSIFNFLIKISKQCKNFYKMLIFYENLLKYSNFRFSGSKTQCNRIFSRRPLSGNLSKGESHNKMHKTQKKFQEWRDNVYKICRISYQFIKRMKVKQYVMDLWYQVEKIKKHAKKIVHLKTKSEQTFEKFKKVLKFFDKNSMVSLIFLNFVSKYFCNFWFLP